MQRLLATLAAFRAFLSRWFWLIITLSLLIGGGSLWRACSVGHEVAAVFHGQPAVPAGAGSPGPLPWADWPWARPAHGFTTP